MWSRLKILHHTRVLDLTQEVFTDNDIIVFKFPQFLLLFFSAIEFCIPFSRKCLPVLTLGQPGDCIEKLGCPLFLSFSSLLFSSLPLLIINSERISFWRFGCHKQLLLVATFPTSLAGHFEEARKSMSHAFKVFIHVGNKITASLSQFCSCAEGDLIPMPSPAIHREDHFCIRAAAGPFV